jgi:hypothetical protein
MAGFVRGTPPESPSRQAFKAHVARLVCDELLPDPFAIAHTCVNPDGHEFTPSCGGLACVHCGRIA